MIDSKLRSYEQRHVEALRSGPGYLNILIPFDYLFFLKFYKKNKFSD